MKKFKKFAYVGAIALLSVVGFTACSSSDDVAVEPNPNYNPETNEVYTQFVFNVSNGSQSGMRQSADATQVSTNLPANKFRGIENAHVMCFIQSGNDGKSLATATTATKDFDMARVAAAGTLSNENSRRVLEMSLPLNTNTMLFYGRAVPNADYNAYGHLDDYTVAKDLSTVNFQLGRRLSTDNKTKFQEIENLFAAVLTCIMNTHRNSEVVSATATPAEGIPAYGFDIAAGDASTLAWSAYANTDKSPVTTSIDITPLEEKLGKAYKEMTTIQEAELRNASGFALKHTIQDLWSIVNAVRCATPTNKEEAIAKHMAHLICEHLSNYFTCASVPTNGASVSGVGFKSASNLITALGADDYWPTATADAKPTADAFSHVNTTEAADLGIFPEQFDLPQGATHIKFDGTKKTFSYVTDYNSSAVGNGTFTVDDYYYPAELLYFGNSSIWVSNDEHVVADYPGTVGAWDTESNWSTWTNTHVESSTRSVAMKNDINYGTSLLKTTVCYGDATLKDNNKAIQQRDYSVTEEDHEIEVTGTSFKLVGIIVGGQWPKVGWNYLPVTTTTDPNYRQGYIFDVDITNNGVIPATGTSEPNYTLVFDNYNPSPTNTVVGAQDKVYIALEFENNTGVDFFGKDNLIKNGGHFYLIGELDPAGKDAPTWPAHHALPPYNADGSSIQTARVFMQDYMTTANFKIGENSLKYAYLTVPDLRSSSVTLGLSVDVNWSTGLTFNEVLLGGN